MQGNRNGETENMSTSDGSYSPLATDNNQSEQNSSSNSYLEEAVEEYYAELGGCGFF